MEVGQFQEICKHLTGIIGLLCVNVGLLIYLAVVKPIIDDLTGWK